MRHFAIDAEQTPHTNRKMRYVILFCFFLSLSCSEKSQSTSPLPPTILKVIVKPGVTLRESPTTKSESLQVIPFGKRIEQLSELFPGEELLGLKGTWKKIKYENQIGWVFGPLVSEIDTDRVLFVNKDWKAVPETNSSLAIEEIRESGGKLLLKTEYDGCPSSEQGSESCEAKIELLELNREDQNVFLENEYIDISWSPAASVKFFSKHNWTISYPEWHDGPVISIDGEVNTAVTCKSEECMREDWDTKERKYLYIIPHRMQGDIYPATYGLKDHFANRE